MNRCKIDFEFEEMERRARLLARAVVLVAVLVFVAYAACVAALVAWSLL